MKSQQLGSAFSRQGSSLVVFREAPVQAGVGECACFGSCRASPAAHARIRQRAPPRSRLGADQREGSGRFERSNMRSMLLEAIPARWVDRRRAKHPHARRGGRWTNTTSRHQPRAPAPSFVLRHGVRLKIC